MTSTYVGRYFLGLQPALSTPELVVPTISLDNLATYPFFALFGLVVGLLATLFIRAIYWFEDRFDSLPGNYYTRHVLGMFGVGSLIYGLMVWFATLAVLGIVAILGHPQVLAAVSPHYAVIFFVNNQWAGFILLGLVFLVVTGGEALYADMGHFGARPIRLA